MTPDKIALVQDSWDKVKPMADQAAEIFYGKLFEKDPEINRIFLERSNIKSLMLLPICAESSRYPILGCSFDGLQFIGNDRGIPVEIKYPAPSTWTDVQLLGEKSKAFQLYQYQVRHQMLVANASFGLLVFGQMVDGQMQLKHFVIEHDDVIANDIIQAAEDFNKKLKSQTPPEVDKNRDILMPQGKLAEIWRPITDQVRELQTKIYRLTSQAEQFETAKKELKAKLAENMDGFKSASLNGVTVTRSVRQGSVDYARLMTDKQVPYTEDELNSYRKDSIQVTQIRVGDPNDPVLPEAIPESKNLAATFVVDEKMLPENDFF